MDKETRSFICEVRAEQDEKHGTYITGRPIVYEQKTDMGWYEEAIDRNALVGCDLRDVRFLVGHNTSMIPLARSRNNNENSTMQLIPGDEGMDIRVDLDTENNVESRALYSATGRGDISGMSFMMIVDRDKDVWTDIESDYPKRRIMSIKKVLEVSAVAFPAYEQTSIQCASEGSTLDSARASLESAKQKLAEERAAAEATEAEAKAKAVREERRTALVVWLENYVKEEK
jgi:hypothetical protein